MARSLSPRKKMTLRKKLKPPKPFAGEVLDDVSSSILGDRSLDSSELEETIAVGSSAAPGSIQSVSSRDVPDRKASSKPPLSKRALDSWAQKAPTKPPANKEGPTPPKQPQLGQEAPQSGISAPKVPMNAWRPGRGMTPKQNTKYLGLQTQFDERLPPAAFPTLDNEELVQAFKRGKAPYNTPKCSRQHACDDNDQNSLVSSVYTSHDRDSRQQDAKESADYQQIQVKFRGQPAAEFLSESSAQMAANDARTTTEIWDGLSIYWRLEILDSIASAFDPPPDANQIFHVLRLTPAQIKAIEEVLLIRSHQTEAENRAERATNYAFHEGLMRRKVAVSEDEFRKALDRTIYKSILPDAQLRTNPNDRQDAVLLLSKANLKSELLYDTILPFTPLQQETTVGDPEGFQQDGTPVSTSRGHSTSVSRLRQKGKASSAYIRHAAPPRTDPMANALHQTPRATYGTYRALKANVPAAEYLPRCPKQVSQTSSTNTTAVKVQTIEDVISSSSKEGEPQGQLINAIAESGHDDQTGAALIAKDGSRGIDGGGNPAASHPASSASYEDWREEMDRRYQMGRKEIDQYRRAFLNSIMLIRESREEAAKYLPEN